MSTCHVADCLRPTRGGREYCEAHAKRLARGTVPVAAPLQEARTPRQTFLDAVLRYAAADSDAEFHKADAALYQAGRRYFATDVKVGRPEKVSAEVAAEVYARWGSIAATARELHVSRRSVQRALARGVRKFRAGVKRKQP